MSEDKSVTHNRQQMDDSQGEAGTSKIRNENSADTVTVFELADSIEKKLKHLQEILEENDQQFQTSIGKFERKLKDIEE